MTLDRRMFLAGAAGAAAVSCTHSNGGYRPDSYVRAPGLKLERRSLPYRIVGANMWYAAWLGADAEFGDRPRLLRELDRLQGLGINNLRIMASAEEGPLKNSIRPGFTRADGSANPVMFEGLDFAVNEMSKRGMTAVLVLSNFWEWSGGLQTLLWRATGEYMDMGDPAHPWPAFPDANAAFYGNELAKQFYAEHVDRVISRTNSINGRPYGEDPTILSWQLANEPRPGGSDEVIDVALASYYDWIDRSAQQIRSLAPNHLVSLGHEGLQGANGRASIVLRAHRDIDYLTAHIWPLNWSWVAGNDLQGTWPTGRANTRTYIEQHERLARELGKALIVEEFGFPRDGESYDPASTTQYREEFYQEVYQAVERNWESGGPLVGSNFWAWNGEARTQHADARFRAGDLAYMGDPPHEPQGWYGVFDSDMTMTTLIRKHAKVGSIR